MAKVGDGSSGLDRFRAAAPGHGLAVTGADVPCLPTHTTYIFLHSWDYIIFSLHYFNYSLQIISYDKYRSGIIKIEEDEVKI